MSLRGKKKPTKQLPLTQEQAKKKKTNLWRKTRGVSPFWRSLFFNDSYSPRQTYKSTAKYSAQQREAKLQKH